MKKKKRWMPLGRGKKEEKIKIQKKKEEGNGRKKKGGYIGFGSG